MNVGYVQVRIAARKALGLSAAEYNARIDRHVEEAKANVTRAITACIRAGIMGSVVDGSLDAYNAAKERLAKALADQEAGIIS